MNARAIISAVLVLAWALQPWSVRALDIDFVPLGRYAKAPGGAVEKILLSGNHAFVAQLPEIDQNSGVVGRGGGLHVVSIIDPARPTPVTRYPTGVILDFDITGTTLVLLEEPRVGPDGSSAGGGLHLIDISDPTNLRRTALYPWPSPGAFSRPIAASGDTVFLGETEQQVHGISVFNISDKLNPRRVDANRLTWQYWPSLLHPAGDYLYVVAETSVQVLNVSNPSVQQRIGIFQAAGNIMAAAVRGQHLLPGAAIFKRFVLFIQYC